MEPEEGEGKKTHTIDKPHHRDAVTAQKEKGKRPRFAPALFIKDERKKKKGAAVKRLFTITKSSREWGAEEEKNRLSLPFLRAALERARGGGKSSLLPTVFFSFRSNSLHEEEKEDATLPCVEGVYSSGEAPRRKRGGGEAMATAMRSSLISVKSHAG